MSISFTFERNGIQEKLTDVDNKIADFLGDKPSENTAIYVDMISDFGVSILLKSRKGVFQVTEKLFDKWFLNLQKTQNERFTKMVAYKDGKLFPALRKFLYQDYIFKAWR